MLKKLAVKVRDSFRQYLQAQGWSEWRSLVPEQELSKSLKYGLEKLLKHESPDSLGNYLEFGVSRGTSMACTYNSLKIAGLEHIRLVGFDSFEGMPDEAINEGWKPGEFWSTQAATQRYLKQQGVPVNKVELVKGWFNDTLTEKTIHRLSLRKASLIMVDCDIYSASKQALMFCAPLIHNYAVILFDDWGWRSDLNEIGQKEAFEEFLQENPELKAEPLPNYLPQSRVFFVKRCSS